jgi:hypothetical protein
MSQLVEVINVGTMPASIEFINSNGDHDSATLAAKTRHIIDEECITTSKENLTKRSIKVRPISSSTPVVETSVAIEAKTNNQPSVVKPTSGTNNSKSMQPVGIVDGKDK